MGEPKTIKVCSYKNFQTEHFLKDLRNLDWSYFNHYHDLDEACKKFNENVKSVAEKHAPVVTQRISGRVEAWITEDLIIAISKKAKKTKSILDWEAFKQKSNHVVQELGG